VDGDMSRFERHGHVLQKQTGNHHQEHVYFVARNPYTRILSLYLQKVVVNACVHQHWSKGMYQPRADGRECMPANKTSFPYFVRHVAKKVKEKGSVCRYNVHLCQQVSSCLPGSDTCCCQGSDDTAFGRSHSRVGFRVLSTKLFKYLRPW
jgi:hypothetical protein